MPDCSYPLLVSHPHLLPTRSHLYIILEFMENGSLSDIIKHCGTLNEELASVYVAQVRMYCVPSST